MSLASPNMAGRIGSSGDAVRLEACVQRCTPSQDGQYLITFGELHGRVLAASSRESIPVGSFVPIIVSDGRARIVLAGRAA